MRSLTIIGIAVVTVFAGCASSSGARREQTTSMPGMCPMEIPGTKVVANEIEGGIRLSFTTTTGDIADLRRRVRQMAKMHTQPDGERMMGGEMKMPAATASFDDIKGAPGSPFYQRIPPSSKHSANTFG